MFRFLARKLRFLKDSLLPPREPEERRISGDLNADLDAIKEMVGNSTDIIFRRFQIGTSPALPAAVVFVDGLINRQVIEDFLMRSLMVDTALNGQDGGWTPGQTLKLIESRMATVSDVARVQKLDQVAENFLMGDTVLLVDGASEGLVFSSKGWEHRAVQEPDTEVVVRGPREGFIENLRTNTAMLRRKIRNPDLMMETMVVGRRTKTRVCITYIKGLAHPRLVEEVRRRIKRLDIDSVLESGYIEELIEDAPFSPFATIGNSEKPDVVARKMLEGRVAVITDGTPHVLTMPLLLIESFQSQEDYYSRPYYASLIRMLRYLGFLVTILAPAMDVALTSYHQELIPTTLLIAIAAGREGTPFPVVIEALMMGLVFEIMREAGVRMPRAIGQAVSIVGALVIGQAAVQAGLISPLMVIVVAFTAIASVVIPPLTDAATMLRLMLTVMAGVLGEFGIVVGVLVVLVHLASVRSFGVPFLSPLAPLSPRDAAKDTVIRAPLWTMFTRPRLIGWVDPQRQEFRLKPEPPGEGE